MALLLRLKRHDQARNSPLQTPSPPRSPSSCPRVTTSGPLAKPNPSSLSPSPCVYLPATQASEWRQAHPPEKTSASLAPAEAGKFLVSALLHLPISTLAPPPVPPSGRILRRVPRQAAQQNAKHLDILQKAHRKRETSTIPEDWRAAPLLLFRRERTHPEIPVLPRATPDGTKERNCHEHFDLVQVSS